MSLQCRAVSHGVMDFIATDKRFYALVGVLLVINQQIRSLPVKLSHFPFTHSLLIFLGNYLPKNNYENRVGPDSAKVPLSFDSAAEIAEEMSTNVTSSQFICMLHLHVIVLNDAH